MDYRKIYVSIVLRAQSEDAERRRNKRERGAYYEKHHIIPKSLGGTNDKSNLAMLTAREHFICHWLLAKMYPPGTKARNKMLLAIWRMRTETRSQQGKRYINAHVYEVLREEFARVVSGIVSRKQMGTGNSFYGMHWYTNAHDGTVMCSNKDLQYPWYKGKSLFKGEFNHLIYDENMKSIARKRVLRPDMVRKARPKYKVFISAEQQNAQRMLNAKVASQNLWDEFHSSSYTSLGEWGREHGMTYQAIRKRFKRFIPIFNDLLKHGVPFASNSSLIGVYKMDGKLNRLSSGLICVKK